MDSMRCHREGTLRSGWTVQGHLELSADGGIVLVVDPLSDFEVHIDPAGRSCCKGSLSPVQSMRVTPVGGNDPLMARLLQTAVRATPLSNESPRLLRSILELIGPALPVGQHPGSDVVEVAIDPRWGPQLSRAGESSVVGARSSSRRGVWRAPADDAVLLDDDTVAVLQHGSIRVLGKASSRVWQEACGTSPGELAEKIGSAPDEMRRIAEDMVVQGLLAAEPSWYIRDSTARAVSTDGHDRYVLAIDREGPALAFEGSGAAVWDVLEECGRPVATSAIVAQIREYHGVRQDIGEDVLAFLMSLAAAGVVAY